MSGNYKDGISFGHAAAVTPHNTNDLTSPCDSLWVGTGGNVKVDTAGGETVTVTSVPNGTCLAIRCTRVYLTGTTASNIVQLWNAIT